jgi:hypothetical protein
MFSSILSSFHHWKASCHLATSILLLQKLRQVRQVNSEQFPVEFYHGPVASVTIFLTSCQLSNRHPNAVTVSKINIKYNSEARVNSLRRWPKLNPLPELMSGVVYRTTRKHLRSLSSSVSESELRLEDDKQLGSPRVWAANRLIALCASSHNMSSSDSEWNIKTLERLACVTKSEGQCKGWVYTNTHPWLGRGR